MAISFNDIPNTIRVPFVYVEFDNSRAVQGPQQQVYRHLVLGIKKASGTAAAATPIRVTSAQQAKEFFGEGSMLHHMFEKHFANNALTETWCIPQLENGAGVAATGTITVTGPATAAGTINILFGDRIVQVGVLSGDAQNAIATAVGAAINAKADLGWTATVATNVVTYTYAHKGEAGNEVIVQHSYYDGQTLPLGVGLTIVAPASGATNPLLTTSIAAMADEQYHVITNPYIDSGSLVALETELSERFGPLKQIEGHAFSCSNRSHANLLTLGDSRNSPHVTIMESYRTPTAPHEKAAALAANASFYAAIDPARPLQTLVLKSVLPPKTQDRLTMAERNLLLYDGIATSTVDAGGLVRIERAITTYQENAFGGPDPSYLDVETLFTLSYLRFDFRVYFQSKYPRYKLAADGARFGAGQAVITPKIGRAEAIMKFRQWEELGLVEGIDQFKQDLIVERNVSDANRLDFLMSPDLVNQFRVLGAKIAFLL